MQRPELKLLKQAKGNLLSGIKELQTRKLPYPPVLVPTVVPATVYEDAKIAGLLIKKPSVNLGKGQLALWTTHDIKAGESVSSQNYWGGLTVRKARNDTRTISLDYEVKVHDEYKSMLVQGDKRCVNHFILSTA